MKSCIFSLQKSRLLKLYGKNSISNNKLRSVDAFQKGKNFEEIGRDLRVQRATAEVYTIDAFAAGKDIDPKRMAELLDVTEESFSALKEALNSKTRLSEVKEALPDCSYNQIRFVLACMIRDVDVEL